MEMSVDVLQQQLGGVDMAEVRGGAVRQCVQEDVVQVPVDPVDAVVSHLVVWLDTAGESDVGGGALQHLHPLSTLTLTLTSNNLQPHPGDPDNPQCGDLTGPALPHSVGEDTGVLPFLPGRHITQSHHHGLSAVLRFHLSVTIIMVDLTM